jgi:hypothetical protein
LARRDLRLWIGVAVFVAVVMGLTIVAISRFGDTTTLAGRWDLVLVETPEGSFAPESGDEWIEFDDGEFRARTACVEIEGEYSVTDTGAFTLGGWGWFGRCDVLEGTSYAFDTYFHQLGGFELGDGLTLQNGDASVQFVFVRAGDDA